MTRQQPPALEDPGLVDWTAGRPFIWVDDEITDADRSWVTTHHDGRALLHHVDPRHGLTDADSPPSVHGWSSYRWP